MEEKIQAVLKDKKTMDMAYSAGLKFSGRLSADEIENCVLHAVWRAVTHYDENREQKCAFTTYLYRGVELECLHYQQRTVMSKQFPSERGDISRHIDSEYMTDERVDMLDEIQNTYDPEVMFDRFYQNMTLQEIADKTGCYKQNIAQKIGKNLDLLRRRMSKSV